MPASVIHQLKNKEENLKEVLKFSVFILIAIVHLFFAASFVLAGKNDTPEGVVNAAKQGVTESADIFTAVNESNSFLNRLASDRAYATKFLESIQKNDPSGVVLVVKQTAPRSQVSINQLRPDFLVIVSFKVKTRDVTLCLSSENGCSGRAVSVNVK